MVNESNHLYIKNTNGVIQTIDLYSTKEEVHNNCISIKIGNTIYYAALVDITNPYASSCRIKKDNTVYAIGTSIIPEYGNQLFTSSSTFIVPSNVYSLRVTCVGGGAGGMTGLTPDYLANGTGTWTFANSSNTVAGGSTSIRNQNTQKVLAQALGGQPASVTFNNYSFVSHTLSQGANPGGGYWSDSDPHGGGGSVSITDISGTVVGSYGSGGICDENNNGRYNYSGGSGFKTIAIVKVSPNDTLQITVGHGGYNWGRGGYYNYNHSSKGYGATVGSPGAAFIEWGEGVA